MESISSTSPLYHSQCLPRRLNEFNQLARSQHHLILVLHFLFLHFLGCGLNPEYDPPAVPTTSFRLPRSHPDVLVPTTSLTLPFALHLIMILSHICRHALCDTGPWSISNVVLHRVSFVAHLLFIVSFGHRLHASNPDLYLTSSSYSSIGVSLCSLVPVTFIWIRL